MNRAITHGRGLAIAAGVAATGGALAILWSDAFRSGEWHLEHWLMPLVVGIAISSGHLVSSALKERKLVSALGFVLMFALATVVTVYNSVGRQAAQSDTADMAAEQSNSRIDNTQSGLLEARKRLTDAEKMVAWEIAGRPNKRGQKTSKTGCGRNCKDWKTRADEVRSHITVLETKLSSLGTKLPVAPKAERAANVAALFGFEQDRVKNVIRLIEPFLFALLFEISAIVAFGYGFAPSSKRKSTKARSHQPVERSPARAPVSKDDHVVDWVHEFRDRTGRDPQIPELQSAFPEVPKTTAWRRCKAA